MRFMMLMIPKGYEQAAPGVMPEQIPPAVDPACLQGLAERLDQPLKEALENGEVGRLLGGEEMVHRCRRYAGLLGDLVNADFIRIVGLQQPLCRLQERLVADNAPPA